MTPILVTLLLVAFFSGIEIAFVSANKLRVELSSKRGGLSAKILSFFVKSPSKLINTTLVGNNVALVLYGLFMSAQLDGWIERDLGVTNEILLLLIDTVIATVVVLLVGEYIPKLIFQLFPNEMLTLFAVPLQLVYLILYLPVSLMTGFSRWFLRVVFKTDTEETEPAFGKFDLGQLAPQGSPVEKTDQPVDASYFHNALELTEARVRECMVPRNDIQWIEANSSAEAVKEVFKETQLSKILVCDGGLDNPIGFVHFLDVLKLKAGDVRNFVLPVLFVPESMLALDLLEKMNKERKSLSVILDEFGGTAGIITKEDIVEEVFGEIQDEHDTEELEEKVLGDGKYSFSGRLEIDRLNEKYDLNLPEEDFETIGGLALDCFGTLPEENETAEKEGYKFTALKVENNRIELLLLEVVH